MIGRILAILLLSDLVASSPAAGQSQGDRNCRDDRGVDRCSDEQQRRMRTLYGARSIEEHSAAGDQVRRIFYVDGYGRDLIMIAFIRTAGRDPTLSVHFPQSDAEARRPEPLQAAVPQQVWDEALERGEHFDRSFVPLPRRGESDAISICMHSWVYTIEAADPPQRGRPAQIRRKIEDACEDGPGAAYALELQRIALALIPHCAALDPTHHRNAATILGACRMLHGDRLAAAEVLNRAHAFRQLDGPGDADRIAGRFANATEIVSNGDAWRGPGYRAAEQWTARLGASSYPTNMYFERVEGETGSRVRLTGRLSRTTDIAAGDARGNESAPVEQLWVRDVNGVMQMERATIGPWRRTER